MFNLSNFLGSLQRSVSPNLFSLQKFYRTVIFFFFFLSFLFGDGETLAITSISQRHGFEYPQPSRLVFFFIIMPRTGKLPSPSFYSHIPPLFCISPSPLSAYRYSPSFIGKPSATAITQLIRKKE